jgi:hypothetical protein
MKKFTSKNYSVLSSASRPSKEKRKELTNGPLICPFCEFHETDADKEGNLLLCETCARELADRAACAHHINCCDW